MGGGGGRSKEKVRSLTYAHDKQMTDWSDTSSSGSSLLLSDQTEDITLLPVPSSKRHSSFANRWKRKEGAELGGGGESERGMKGGEGEREGEREKVKVRRGRSLTRHLGCAGWGATVQQAD